ncbi:hypothetical protein CFD26_105573 [Aspergillus turcosus]|uniref:FAD dependent oxidoreductase domain-containing protein n=1 Tax=Aspergillus turcosus TaxID=1245748 RepID=A0A3R7F7F3_9EURO|nr:hypothetical protein CFD26_105573 [Aspergillus turcosus]
METSPFYDVAVVGGGAIGLSAAHEVAKGGSTVVVIEKNQFFNQAGSSGDLARMFRTMYTEGFMADLANESIRLWDELEAEAGEKLRLMSGLLNFGDPNYGAGGPEGTLMGPKPNLDRLNMRYSELSRDEIEAKYAFRRLPADYIGLYAPDNGIINVPRLLRSLYRLAEERGAKLHQHTSVQKMVPAEDGWLIQAIRNGSPVQYRAKKVIIACGAYTNHILRESFNVQLDLDIWEMVSCYFDIDASDEAPSFPSMWFQFQDDINGQSKLFYGFPPLPWGPPNLVRVAVDTATRRIRDPEERSTDILSPEDIANVQSFVREHMVGVDSTVPALTGICLQTNTFDNMFVLDHIPEQYLNGGAPKSVALFTAGWAMKFVPLLGQALKELVIEGDSERFALEQFSITRKDPVSGKSLLVECSKKVPPSSWYQKLFSWKAS